MRLRLLLIDDDPVLLKSLRDALGADGHVIVAANGGQEGVAAFGSSLSRGEPFAAVITDLGMPYMDGRGQRLIAEGDTPPCVDRVLAKPPKLREALVQLCPATPDPSA